jgi:hypothetical protein
MMDEVEAPIPKPEPPSVLIYMGLVHLIMAESVPQLRYKVVLGLRLLILHPFIDQGRDCQELAEITFRQDLKATW